MIWRNHCERENIAWKIESITWQGELFVKCAGDRTEPNLTETETRKKNTIVFLFNEVSWERKEWLSFKTWRKQKKKKANQNRFRCEVVGNSLTNDGKIIPETNRRKQKSFIYAKHKWEYCSCKLHWHWCTWDNNRMWRYIQSKWVQWGQLNTM